MIEFNGTDLGYGRKTVIRGLDLAIPRDSLTMIIGPNGCGKSTVLRAMARILSPTTGSVILDGADIRSLKTRELARRLGMLAQHSDAPEDIRVAELVARGRYPHQGRLRRWSPEDEDAVQSALRTTGVLELSEVPVDQLSGGQRQRVWIAMVLAQETGVVLLDEPTTFLDLPHQLDIMEICRALVESRGRTVAAVVHDMSQACRYATHLIVMKDGAVVATGHPDDIVSPDLLREVFGVEAEVIVSPESGVPVVVPLRTVAQKEPE